MPEVSWYAASWSPSQMAVTMSMIAPKRKERDQIELDMAPRNAKMSKRTEKQSEPCNSAASTGLDAMPAPQTTPAVHQPQQQPMLQQPLTPQTDTVLPQSQLQMTQQQPLRQQQSQQRNESNGNVTGTEQCALTNAAKRGVSKGTNTARTGPCAFGCTHTGTTQHG